MVVIILWSLLCMVPILCSGCILANLFRKEEKREVTQLFFLGFGGLSILFSYVSIFLPLNITSFVISSLLIVLIYFFTNSQSVLPHKKIFSNDKMNYWLITICSIIALYISTGFHIYDTGLYHSQNIQWIQKFPLVPGLGNLHGRFAFNSQFFPISALFTLSSDSFLIYPINGIVVSILLFKLFSVGREQKNLHNLLLYAIPFLFIFIYLIKRVATPQPDVICTCLIVYSFILLVKRRIKRSSFDDALIILMVLICPLMKLSNLPALLLLIPLIPQFKRKQLFFTLLLFIVSYFPFLYKNYILSGYLIYPFPGIDIFSPDWKIPFNRVLDEKSWIESWARIPKLPYQEVLSMKLAEWLPIWFTSLRPIWIIVFSINIIGFFPALIKMMRKEKGLGSLYLIFFINLLFWLFTAPDPRFSFGVIFSFTALSLFGILRFFWIELKLKLNQYIFVSLLLIGVISNLSLLKSKSFTMFLVPKKTKTTDLQLTQTNFKYFVPLAGDQCFNSYIPCSPYSDTTLIMRGKSLREGFRIK